MSKKSPQSVFSVDCITERERKYIKLSPTLNDIMGGLLGGSFVIVTGVFKGGKSATCLDIAKRAQQVGYKILYADIEHRLNKRDLLSTKGLDLSADKFEIMRSSAGNILTAEDFMELLRAKMEAEDNLLVIADSVSQLCPRDLREGDIGDKYRDSTPGLLSRFSKVLAPVLGVTNNIFIGITHVIANSSGMGHKTKIEASGNKIQYAMDFKIAVNYATKWEVGDKVIGQDIHWECVNSILVPKGRSGTGKLRFGTEEEPEGIDEAAELFELATNSQIITTKGAWYSFGDIQKQGAANFIEEMRTNPEMYAEIDKRVEMFLSAC